MKRREVTNFAKGGNLIASLCKISYFLFEHKKDVSYVYRLSSQMK